jgi:predicted Fe-Mo cluster-binding NifX family protein
MLAIPVFRSRVAPVLNWCSKMHIFQGEATDASCRDEIILLNMGAFERLKIIHQEGVQTLICGALSPDLLSYGERIGLNIIYGVSGEVADVLQAYHTQTLDNPRFRLPGCRGPRTYRKGWRQDCIAEEASGEMSQAHDSPESTRIRATKRGAGKMSAAGRRAGAGGFCVCPRCGTMVRHQRGIPCTQVICPECEQPLVRT